MLSPKAAHELKETVRRVLTAGTTRTHERPAAAARGSSGSDTIGVRNVGDFDAPEGGVVAIVGVDWPKGRGPIWKIDRPTKDLARLYAIVAQDKIKKGERGAARFAFGGPAWALADDVPDEDDDVKGGQAWGIVADSFKLKPLRPGFAAVGAVKRRDATKDRPKETLVAIEQAPPPQWIGKPKQAIGAGEVGAITLWSAGAAAIGSTPKVDPAALGLFVDAFALTESVAQDRWVAVTWIAGRWIVTPLECA